MKTLLVIIISIIGIPAIAHAEDPPANYNGTLRITVDELPVYDDYQAEIPEELEIAKGVDWDSYKGSRNYKTRLRDALKEGADFAGHYSVVSIGCGTACQDNWILDVTSGRILGTIPTAGGIFYQKDSRLLVTNLPAKPEEMKAPYASMGTNIEFYEVKDGALNLIRSVDMYGLQHGTRTQD